MQGSGKGTQARLLANKYNFNYFETGAQLRKLASENSQLGNKIKHIIESGNLVPNQVVMEMIEDYFNKIEVAKPIIFDGVPRFQEQKTSLENLLQKHMRKALGVLIEISEQEAIKRLSLRRMCPSCKTVFPSAYKEKSCEHCQSTLEVRADDTSSSTIQKRLEAYKKETMPVIDEYRAQNKLIVIDGEQNIEKVESDLIEKMKEWKLIN